jgi:hypothetical protein
MFCALKLCYTTKVMIEKNMEFQKNPNWIQPDLKKEQGEIERVVREFLKKEPDQENIDTIIYTLESAPLIDLSEEEWRLLENTDSFNNVRPGNIEDAKRITEEYNLELAPENRRTFASILKGFSGGNMEAPTILKNAHGILHLISGNTRLMVARALGIRPKVIIAEVK